MKAEALDRRVTALEARWLDAEDADRSRTRAFLARLTDEELDQYGEIALRYESGVALTEEEERFLEELAAKYGYES